MKRICLCCLLVLPLLGWAQVFEANPTAAKEIWESVVAAKGGRARLHAVRTFGVSLKGGTWYEPRYQLRAYEFPSKVWMRAGPVESFVGVYDSGRGAGAYVRRYYRELHVPKKGQVEDGGRIDNPVTVKRSVDGEVCYAIYNFLPETSWYRPEIVAVREVKWKEKDAFVLYLNDCVGASAYIIDAKTRLPREYISFINKPHERWKTELPEVLTPDCPRNINDIYYYISMARYEDYVSVAGVKLPRRIEQSGGGKMTYEIDQEYAALLFTTPPTLSDWGPWPAFDRR